MEDETDESEERYQMPKVTSQMATKKMTDIEKSMVADYLTQWCQGKRGYIWILHYINVKTQERKNVNILPASVVLARHEFPSTGFCARVSFVLAYWIGSGFHSLGADSWRVLSANAIG
ncbi:hypothetical protein MHYP_G00203860 [Metynnis hypsauchen]